MVPHYESLVHGLRRFVGREYREIEPGLFGFAPTNEAEEVPDRAEYREAVRHGDAEAADEVTARTCGVAFVAAPPTPPPAQTAVHSTAREEAS